MRAGNPLNSFNVEWKEFKCVSNVIDSSLAKNVPHLEMVNSDVHCDRIVARLYSQKPFANTQSGQ